MYIGKGRREICPSMKKRNSKDIYKAQVQNHWGITALYSYAEVCWTGCYATASIYSNTTISYPRMLYRPSVKTLLKESGNCPFRYFHSLLRPPILGTSSGFIIPFLDPSSSVTIKPGGSSALVVTFTVPSFLTRTLLCIKSPSVASLAL